MQHSIKWDASPATYAAKQSVGTGNNSSFGNEIKFAEARNRPSNEDLLRGMA